MTPRYVTNAFSAGIEAAMLKKRCGIVGWVACTTADGGPVVYYCAGDVVGTPPALRGAPRHEVSAVLGILAVDLARAHAQADGFIPNPVR